MANDKPYFADYYNSVYALHKKYLMLGRKFTDEDWKNLICDAQGIYDRFGKNDNPYAVSILSAAVEEIERQNTPKKDYTADLITGFHISEIKRLHRESWKNILRKAIEEG